MCAMYGPDVVVLDGALGQLEEQLRTLREAPETAGVELVVAQADEGATPSLQSAGARTVLTSNVSPAALWRAVNKTRSEDYDLPPAREPFGDVVLRDLCDRVSREIRRGLFEAADADAQSTVFSLGEGTEVRAAIWAAVARIEKLPSLNPKVGFTSGRDLTAALFWRPAQVRVCAVARWSIPPPLT